MGLFSSRKKSRLAVLIHDGEVWRGYVLVHGRPQWHCVEQRECPGKNPRQIPAGLLDFAEQNRAGRIRILVPSEVVTLAEVEYPLDSSPEEMQAVTLGLFCEETGQEWGTQRVCAVQAERFQMGATLEMVMVSAFETSLLESYEKNCRSVRIPFEGMGALELALLAAHTREHSEERFLLLRRESGFYATHATDFLPMSVHALALGAKPDERGREPERLQRAAKRLETQSERPLRVISALPLSEERKMELADVYGAETVVTYGDYASFLMMAAQEVAGEENPGAPGGGGSVCGVGEEEKDPYRAGTWLFFAALLLAVFFVWGVHAKLSGELALIQEKTVAWEKLQAERKKQKDLLHNIDSDRARYEAITKILQDTDVLPVGWSEILSELDQNMPPYTRLLSMSQSENGEYTLLGSTFYQKGLMEFIPLLNVALQEYSLLAELVKLEKRADSREQEFVLRVVPQKQ
ncbi:MAG: hypothetical protein Q4D62_06725 [Planctomycetia bacterium]|nr:hypothetical protein [Planctomycetia bacterium]